MNNLHRAILVFVGSLALLAVGVPVIRPSAAAVRDGDLSSVSTARGAYVDVGIETRGDRQPGGAKNPAPHSSSTPQLVTKWLPDCQGNNANTATIETCANAMLGCAEGVRMRPWTAPPGTTLGTPNWTPGAAACRTAGAALNPMPAALTLTDFRRLPLPAGTSHLQPAGDSVLIRMRNVVYTTSTEPVELTTTLAGQQVRVRATPVSWTWNFGDGTTIGPTTDPGRPSPDQTHEHAYTTRGTFTISMTTDYTGQYSIAGRPWQPVTGQAHVTGTTRTVRVLTGTARLIDQP